MLAMLLAACGPAVAPKHAVRADGGPTAPAKPASPSFADLPALSGLDAAVQSDFRSSSPLEPDAGRLTAAFEHARYCYHLQFRMQASRRMDESCQAAFKDGATTEAAEACRSRAMRMDVERAGLKEPFAGCAGDAKASRRYAEPALAQRVERSIQVEYTQLNMQTHEPMLSAERMTEGLAEAEAIYRRYFADGPLLKEPPVVCKSGFGSSAPWL